jgi:DNA-binding MltR family transcriptional regulator
MAGISDTIDNFLNATKRLGGLLDQVKPHLPTLLTISDAHHVIIGASQLDNALEAALLAKMRQLSRDARDKLFDGYGPLNTFSAKIDISYAFNIIDNETYTSLRAVNRIRNKFAHTEKYLGFNDQDISSLIDSLPGMDLTIDNKTVRFVTWINGLKSSLEAIANNSSPQS